MLYGEEIWGKHYKQIEENNPDMFSKHSMICPENHKLVDIT